MARADGAGRQHDALREHQRGRRRQHIRDGGRAEHCGVGTIGIQRETEFRSPPTGRGGVAGIGDGVHERGLLSGQGNRGTGDDDGEQVRVLHAQRICVGHHHVTREVGDGGNANGLRALRQRTVELETKAVRRQLRHAGGD